MDMILLDWTRMGRSYCLAGVVDQEGPVRVVRPLLTKFQQATVRNVGWSPYLLDGHSRWETFELVGPVPADPQAPHFEDLWVRGLKPRGLFAPPDKRRSILEATAAKAEESIFGGPLILTRSAAYLQPGTGQRSLATVLMPTDGISFHASQREGAEGTDIRVAFRESCFGERWLPVKDHFLLGKAERAAADLNGQVRTLNQLVRHMGSRVAVRLGLSRAFPSVAGRSSPFCWIMVDGFFSLDDPQP